jgi:hypothetical protein
MKKEITKKDRKNNVAGVGIEGKGQTVDSVRLELGWGLIPLVEPMEGSVLLNQITMLRETLRDCGITMPSVRIVDDMVYLGSTGYRVTVYGVEPGWANLPTRLTLPEQALAITGHMTEILKTHGDIFSRTLPDGSVVPRHTDHTKVVRLKPKNVADDFFRQAAYIAKVAAELERLDREKALELQSRETDVIGGNAVN